MKLARYILIAWVFAFVSGCATVKESVSIPAPKTFTESLTIAQGEIKALRETTAFVIQSSGVDCVNDTFKPICVVGRQINNETRQYRDTIDLMLTAYTAANNQLFDCKIDYGGVVIPCEDQYDHILVGLINLKKLLVPAPEVNPQ